jgi:hypothetical protein
MPSLCIQFALNKYYAFFTQMCLGDTAVEGLLRIVAPPTLRRRRERQVGAKAANVTRAASSGMLVCPLSSAIRNHQK